MDSLICAALEQFHEEMAEWAQAGCPAHEVFGQRAGLCLNLQAWAKRENLPDFTVLAALRNMFGRAGLNQLRPFNNNDLQYIAESRTLALYKNAARAAWLEGGYKTWLPTPRESWLTGAIAS